jgi:hypothetical protein
LLGVPFDVNAFRYHEPGHEPAPPPEPPPPPKKVYPPAPPGFVRTEDGYAVPAMFMKVTEPQKLPKKPFMRVSPPKKYKFNERTQAWEPSG